MRGSSYLGLTFEVLFFFVNPHVGTLNLTGLRGTRYIRGYIGEAAREKLVQAPEKVVLNPGP